MKRMILNTKNNEERDEIGKIIYDLVCESKDPASCKIYVNYGIWNNTVLINYEKESERRLNGIIFDTMVKVRSKRRV